MSWMPRSADDFARASRVITLSVIQPPCLGLRIVENERQVGKMFGHGAQRISRIVLTHLSRSESNLDTRHGSGVFIITSEAKP